MHFWIDKRSQQCGFGRSRVAASLSGAGGSGFGFGHPPRRIHANKSNHSSHNTSTVPVHRHQRQHFTTSHSNSNVDYHRNPTYRGNNSSNNNNNNNNNNNAVNTGHSITVFSQPTNNNNNQQHNNIAYINQSHPTYSSSSSSSNNNNNNNNATVTDTARSTRNHLPNLAMNCGTQLQQQQQQQQQQQSRQQYDMRSYHHPQFGNMSVRHYPQSSERAALERRHYSCPQNLLSSTIVQQQQQQQQQQQTITNNSFPAAADLTRHYVRDSEANNANHLRTSSSYATTNSSLVVTHPYHSHNQHSTALHSMNSVDNQLLPTHLKCGMCASLVLASVFVAGAKFYFDHQGTGLEVLIFCAFSATFFLAACTVSLCRVPKGLLPQQRSSLDQRRGTGCHLNGHGSTLTTATDEMIQINGLHELAERSHSITSTLSTGATGPPPYHIAILLPETKNIEKEVSSLEESPPPSYDKIVV